MDKITKQLAKELLVEPNEITDLTLDTLNHYVGFKVNSNEWWAKLSKRNDSVLKNSVRRARY